MSKIEEPIRMNVAAAKVRDCRLKLKLPDGTPAVYVVDMALREFVERKERK